MCLLACMYTMCASDTLGYQRKVLDSLISDYVQIFPNLKKKSEKHPIPSILDEGCPACAEGQDVVAALPVYNKHNSTHSN